jgi:hypothetical protein
MLNSLLDRKSEPHTRVQRGAVVDLAIELGYVDSKFSCLESSPTPFACDEMRLALDRWARALETTTPLDVAPPTLIPCPVDGEARWPETAYGKGLCILPRSGSPPHLGVLSISPFALDCESTRNNDWACLRPRARQSVVAWGAIDQDVGDWIARRPLTTLPMPVQVFFLSPEGVLGRWAVDEAVPKALLSDFRGRDYVDGTREGPSGDLPGAAQFETGVYLDVGGHGLVRMLCRRALRGLTSEQPVQLGVMCIDYLPPSGKVAPPNGVISHSRIEQTAHELLTPELSAEERAAVDRSLQGVKERVDVVDVGTDPPMFLVPLSATGESTSYVAIRPQPQRFPASLWLMLGAIGLAIGTTVYTVAVRRQQFNVEDEYTLLRKLQVAVIRTNSKDELLEANDRAEELLGEALPVLGSENKKGIKLGRLFDMKRVRLLRFLPPKAPETMGDTETDDVTMAKVNQGRSAGIWSRYYLPKRAPHRGQPGTDWLGVVGSPLLGDDEAKGSSFAILVVPSKGRRRSLT